MTIEDRSESAPLSSAKRALLHLWKRGAAAQAVAPDAILRRAVPGPVPLSFAQQRLWFIEQLQPGNTAYSIPSVLRLRGVLDRGALEQSFRVVFERHAVLRTTFAAIDGQAIQVVGAVPTVVIPVTDLRGVAGAEEQAWQLVRSAAMEPFDLVQGPLLRYQLFLVADDDALLLLAMHHIISDGWSMGVLTEEVVRCYRGFAAGDDRPARSLPELPIQYTDFAVWQREWLQGERLEEQLGYWRRQLADAPMVLELPTDRPRPRVASFRGAKHYMTFSRELTDGMVGLGRLEHGTTVFMVMMAAFQVLLGRYSGQTDVLVGTPVAGRNRREVEPLIGCFTNTLVIRCRLEGNPSVRSLVAQVREATLEASMHQDVPFERLVDALNIPRSLSYSPLFQVMLAFQNAPHPPAVLPGLVIDAVDVDIAIAQFDVTFSLRERAGEVDGTLIYSTDLFDAATMARMAGHLQVLVAGMLADPDQAIADVPLLSVAERRMMMVDWNATQVAYAQGGLDVFFEAIVARVPDAVAVVAPWGESDVSSAMMQVTYAELQWRAGQVARRLCALGVRDEVVVGLCVERAVPMVIGVVGIVKAGGVYLPLDAGTPFERLAWMVHDAQARVVLVTRAVFPVWAEARAAGRVASALVRLDDDWGEIAQESTGLVRGRVAGEQLAYVMYTSGSTGVPKGIGVPHRAVGRLVFGERYLQVQAGDRVAQVANSAFDATTFEVWGALLHGVPLVVIARDTLLMPQAFAAALRDYGVTVMFLTAALFHQMAQVVPSAFRGLRQLLVGGEAMDPAHTRAVLAGEAPVALLNAYGPTETTTFAVCHVVRQVPPAATAVPIGQPISNTQVYVLDRRYHPVPVGVVGELFIGGAGVARGYYGRPDLTAERFVPNPFGVAIDAQSAHCEVVQGGVPALSQAHLSAEVPNPLLQTRLYRTGDRVYWRADGVLVFVGRADQQVKVRGFRIELDEVAAVTMRYVGVQACVVVMREDRVGDRRLVAYIVPHPDAQVVVGQGEEVGFAAQVRAFLVERLPEYMVPSAVVLLEQLPQTANGKLDRRALPPPNAKPADVGAALAPPQTAVEQQLAVIWGQLLGRERVGRHENFFALGGDSILSIQIVARAAQVGLQMTPKHLFQYQTIAELAAVVGRSEQVVADQGPFVGAVPLTPIQHWFFAQQQADAHHFNHAVLLQTSAPLDRQALAQVVRALFAHHDMLRARFVRTAGGWEQVVAAPDGAVPLVHVDLSRVDVGIQAQVVEQIATILHTGLCLEVGPLVRVATFAGGVGVADRVLVIVHHLVIDGVSWRIVLDDFQRAYGQACRQAPIQLLPKTSSFYHWAVALGQFATCAAVQAEEAYWLDAQRWSGSRLPRARVAPTARLVSTARSVRVALSAEETHALLHEAGQAYTTQVHEVLLTALARALLGWVGGTRVLVDLERHGRAELFADVDMTRTVGWCTSIAPVLLDVTGRGGLGAQVMAVKEQVRAAPNQGVGYGVLRFLRGEESARRFAKLPQAEVSFNYLGQLDQVLVGEGQWFTPAVGATGMERSARGWLSHRLAVDSQVVNGQLETVWVFSTAQDDESTIAGIARAFLQELRWVIAHCCSPEAGGLTPSDFALARLTEADLAIIIKQFSR